MIAITGFHRSGTSFVARLLSEAGVFVGEELLGAASSNRHGHFEDREVLDLHNQILSDNAKTWRVADDFIPVVNDDIWEKMRALVDKREQSHEVWGFKDPRACLFLPLWRHVYPNLHVVAVYRHPSECVRSLHSRAARELFDGVGIAEQRYDFWHDPDLALKMWIFYNRSLWRSISLAQSDVVVANFASLLAGESLVAAVNEKWDLELHERLPEQIADLNDVHWLDEGTPPTDDETLWCAALQIWDRFERISLASGGVTPGQPR